MVNSVGVGPPHPNSEPPHTSPNPGSFLASVAARRPDFLYTELYRNLLKASKSQLSEAANDYDPRSHKLISNVCSKGLVNDQPHFGDDKKLTELKDEPPKVVQKLPKYDLLSNTIAPSPLRTFYEGIYGHFAPNDYLLRFRAEQHLAANRREGFQGKNPFPRLNQCTNFTNQDFSRIQSNCPSAFRRAGKTPYNTPHRVRQAFPKDTAPDSASVTPLAGTNIRHVSTEHNNSPQRSEGSAGSPLDFSAQKPQQTYSNSADGEYKNFPARRRPSGAEEGIQSKAERREFLFNFRSVTMSATTQVQSDVLPLPSSVGRAPGNLGSGESQEEQTTIDADTTCLNSMHLSCTRPDSHLSASSPALMEPRLKRKRRLTSSADTCPVCGVTVRASEMKQHFSQEVVKLEKITQEVGRNSRRYGQDRKATASSAGCLPGHSGTSVTPTTSKKQNDGDCQLTSSKENRFKTFQKVHGNRVDRFNSRVGRCQSSLWGDSMLSCNVAGNPSANPSKLNGAAWMNYNRSYMTNNKPELFGVRFEGVHCPVCSVSLSHLSNHDQISDHVIQCASSAKINGESSEAMDVDVKRERQEEECDVDVADVERSFGEEYEWCGQTRVRATALVHRELLASTPGFQVIRGAENEDSDQDLNVETDETGEFGGAQFTDKDLVAPCPSDEEGTSSHDHRLNPAYQSCTPTENACGSNGQHSTSNNFGQYHRQKSPSVIIQALHLKIQELENEKPNSHCLICMEPYKAPLVSIQCWHVHCERCWMRALGVKKLCPQCNMITPASQLRRIYL